MTAPPGSRRPPRARRVRTDARWDWVDLRLLPAAGTVWVVTLVTPRLAPALSLAVGGGAAVVGAVLLSRWRRGGAGRAAVLAGCLAALTVAAVLGGVRAQLDGSSPLRPLAARESVAPVVLRVDDDPRPLSGAGAPRVLVAATVQEVDGRPIRAARVLLFGPAIYAELQDRVTVR